MKQFLILVTLFVCFVASAMQTIQLSSGLIIEKDACESPKFEILETEDGAVVTYTFSEAVLTSIPNEEGEQQYMLSMDYFGTPEEDGQPAIPSRIDLFNIGLNEVASIELVDSTYNEWNLPIGSTSTVYTKSGYVTINRSVNTNGFYPVNVAEVNKCSKFNNNTIAEIRVNPISYNSTKKAVRAYTKLCYKITYDKSALLDSIESSNQNQESYDNQISTLSYDPSEPINLQENKEQYLIITTSKFKEAAEDLAEFKRTLGFNVSIEYPTGEVWNTVNEVMNVINNYQDSASKLSYVLYLGDNHNIPAFSKNQNGGFYDTFLSDLDYATSSGTSTFAQFAQGRIPAKTLEEAKAYLKKLKIYETPSDTFNSTGEFYNDYILLSYFHDDNNNGTDEEIFMYNSELIRNYLISKEKNVFRKYGTNSSNPTKWYNGQLIPAELKNLSDTTIYQSGWCVIPQMSKGYNIIHYNSHGGANQFSYIWFTSLHARAMTNMQKPSIFFNMSCYTGRYHYADDTKRFEETNVGSDCLSRELLFNSKGGASNVIASTGASYKTENAFMSKSLYGELWSETLLTGATPSELVRHTNRIGDILNTANLYTYQKYSGGNHSKMNMQMYHVLGDPAMRIWTDTPMPVQGFKCLASGNKGSAVISLYSDNATEYILYNTKTKEVKKFTSQLYSYTVNDPYNVKITALGQNVIPKTVSLSNYMDYTVKNMTYIKSVSRQFNNVVITVANGNNYSNPMLYIYSSYGTLVKSVALQPGTADQTVNVTLSSGKSYVITLVANDMLCDSKSITL